MGDQAAASIPSRSVHALLLAGQRPGTDSLAAHFGITAKALVRLAGEPMLSRVARTLVDHPAIGRVTVIAQDWPALIADPDCVWIQDHPLVDLSRGGPMISLGVLSTMGQPSRKAPVLITTADHPLLDRFMIDEFLAKGLASGADFAVALVERSTLLDRIPDARRTWLRFGGGAYSGANLFLATSPKARKVVEFWSAIEANRKKGLKLVAAFGPWLLMGVLLRILSLRRAIQLAGRKLGAEIVPVEMSDPLACIDVDKPADHALAQVLLQKRAADFALDHPLHSAQSGSLTAPGTLAGGVCGDVLQRKVNFGIRQEQIDAA